MTNPAGGQHSGPDGQRLSLGAQQAAAGIAPRPDPALQIFRVRVSHRENGFALVEWETEVFHFRQQFTVRPAEFGPEVQDFIEGFIGGICCQLWHHFREEGQSAFNSLVLTFASAVEQKIRKLQARYRRQRLLELQLRQSTHCVHDDLVDSAAYAINAISGLGALRPFNGPSGTGMEMMMRTQVVSNPLTGAYDEQRRQANARARELLVRNLNTEQRAQFVSKRKFVVLSKNGRRYEIVAAETYNVRDIEDDTHYCGQLTDVPIYDQMLAQKILLESDPDAFFMKANKRPVVRVNTNGCEWFRPHWIAPGALFWSDEPAFGQSVRMPDVGP